MPRGTQGGALQFVRTDELCQSSGYSAAPRREMFVTTCASCNGEARVPFQPRGDKPVYCSDCFETQRGARRTPAPASDRYR